MKPVLLVTCLAISLMVAHKSCCAAALMAESPPDSSEERMFSALPPASRPTPPARPSGASVVPVYTYKVLKIYPHDRNAFTQGLVVENGILYEGTGRYGQSSVRKVELATGALLQIHRLPDRFFGEGITIFENRMIQLTWRSKIGFVYDKNSFQLINVFRYPTEGWGITHDGKLLIMSDGSSRLHFLNPDTFKEIRWVEVRDNNGPVPRLNELEYVNGEIYANIWPSDRVARIAPDTGKVVGWIHLSGLLGSKDRSVPVDVLNGIAYDSISDRLFVTGKLWPKLFEIRLVPPR